MKFREHRGSLEHSMLTVIELGDHFADLCNHLRLQQLTGLTLLPTIYHNDQITFKPLGNDHRIDWSETWLVALLGFGVLGMTDRLPEGISPEQVLAETSPELVKLAKEYEFKEPDYQVESGKKHYLTTAGANLSPALIDINPLTAEMLANLPLNQGLTQEQLSVLTGAVAMNTKVGGVDPMNFDLTTGSFTRADLPATNTTVLGYDVRDSSVKPAVSGVEPQSGAQGQDEAITGAEWFKQLRDLVANEDNDQALILIDSLSASTAQTISPPAKVEPGQGAAAFDKLGAWVRDFGHPDFEAWYASLPPHIASQWKQADAGMVIVPDAEHMTEEMVDASRGLHLYYMEGGSAVSCEHMRKHLSRYAPWAAKHYPQWFREDNGHLTKAGRAQIAHALTVGAYFDPDARQEYFDARRTETKGRIWDNPFHQRVRMTFKPMVMGEVFDDGGFVVHKRFSDSNLVGDNRYLITLNRSDLPKEHRKKFKQTSVAIFMNLEQEGREVVFSDVIVYPKLDSSSFEVTPTMASRF